MNGTELRNFSPFLKFLPESHTQTLAEIFKKLTNYEVCLHSL